MKKFLAPFFSLMLLAACNNSNEAETKSERLALNESVSAAFHDFVVKDLNGEEYAFSQLKGKRVLVVNTASKCGYTPQYEGLQKLYKQYGNEQFVVIGFPCNQFMNQEPGSNEEIASFCQKNYGVDFPMMDKIDVKGSEQHPLYTWLTSKEQNGVDDARVSWNFNKFLIDEKGNWIAHYGSRTEPMDEEIVAFAKGS
ncbi:MAG: glutathione peroxidase [Croceimicrobium sp.]